MDNNSEKGINESGGEILPMQNVYLPDFGNESKTNSLQLKQSNLSDLSYLLDLSAEGGLDPKLINELIDIRLLVNERERSDIEELAYIHNGIRNLYDTIVEIINSKKVQVIQNKNKVLDMNQPKYKISVVAHILKVERATVNNWTINKGGYIRSFEQTGLVKHILEIDLKEKYKEVTGQDLIIDAAFRARYSYKLTR